MTRRRAVAYLGLIGVGVPLIVFMPDRAGDGTLRSQPPEAPASTVLIGPVGSRFVPSLGTARVAASTTSSTSASTVGARSGGAITEQLVVVSTSSTAWAIEPTSSVPPMPSTSEAPCDTPTSDPRTGWQPFPCGERTTDTDTTTSSTSASSVPDTIPPGGDF